MSELMFYCYSCRENKTFTTVAATGIWACVKCGGACETLVPQPIPKSFFYFLDHLIKQLDKEDYPENRKDNNGNPQQ
jgi:transcription elongation factor Elf1